MTPGDPSSAMFMGPAHRQSATEAEFNKRIGQAGSSSFKYPKRQEKATCSEQEFKRHH